MHCTQARLVTTATPDDTGERKFPIKLSEMIAGRKERQHAEVFVVTDGRRDAVYASGCKNTRGIKHDGYLSEGKRARETVSSVRRRRVDPPSIRPLSFAIVSPRCE